MNKVIKRWKYCFIKQNKDANEILKVFSIPLIVIASVFVVISHLGASMLTPLLAY